jgi:hypothetical protein
VGSALARLATGWLTRYSRPGAAWLAAIPRSKLAWRIHRRRLTWNRRIAAHRPLACRATAPGEAVPVGPLSVRPGRSTGAAIAARVGPAVPIAWAAVLIDIVRPALIALAWAGATQRGIRARSIGAGSRPVAAVMPTGSPLLCTLVRADTHGPERIVLAG